MIVRALQSSANQNGGQASDAMLELGTERPPTAPTQLSKHLIFGAAASATARQAPPRERFDSHLSLLIFEER